jgi:hypothetical protein
MSNDMMGFGSQKEWHRFNENFPKFVKKYPAIEVLRAKVFERQGIGNKVDRVIFGLGRVCYEDFQQALILCGNGFGIGALQLVRGMYEREVTAVYLMSHPDEVDNFLDYHFVQLRKGMVHLRQVYKGDDLTRIIPKARQEEVERDFEGVKARFTETICGTCHKTKVMGSWTKHNMPLLAAKAGHNLGEQYFYDYFRPTMFAHSTVSSLIARLRQDEGGGFVFDNEGQRRHTKEALVYIHFLVIHVLGMQNEHFKFGLDDEIHALLDDYEECWKDFKMPIESD